jgi:triosephosphate isomerase
MTTTGKFLRAALGALLTATETAMAFSPSMITRYHRGTAVATALRDTSSQSSSYSPISGREKRSNFSTYAPYSTIDGRVGVGGVVGSPNGSFGTGMGAGTMMISSSSSSSSTPTLHPAKSHDVVHVDRATPSPPLFGRGGRIVDCASSSSSSPPKQYAIGSWEVPSSSSSIDVVVSRPPSTTIPPSPPPNRPPRRPIVAGNWKLNPPTRSEAVTLLRLLAANFVNHRDGNEYPDDDDASDGPEVVIFPPLPYLSDAIRILEGSGILVGAQDCGMHDGGAYTGEVAPSMLLSMGCSYVLLGHSERRVHFGETDASINMALRGCLDVPGLRVVLCVGETLEEYENGMLERVIDEQLSGCLNNVDASAILRDGRVVIAYEPVWAIGTGLVATPSQAQAAHVAILNSLSRVLRCTAGEVSDGAIRIIYGGSVTPDTVLGIMDMPDVDGALVGGASLNADSFTRIYDGTNDAYDGKKKASGN